MKPYNSYKSAFSGFAEHLDHTRPESIVKSVHKKSGVEGVLKLAKVATTSKYAKDKVIRALVKECFNNLDNSKLEKSQKKEVKEIKHTYKKIKKDNKHPKKKNDVQATVAKVLAPAPAAIAKPDVSLDTAMAASLAQADRDAKERADLNKVMQASLQVHVAPKARQVAQVAQPDTSLDEALAVSLTATFTQVTLAPAPEVPAPKPEAPIDEFQQVMDELGQAASLGSAQLPPVAAANDDNRASLAAEIANALAQAALPQPPAPVNQAWSYSVPSWRDQGSQSVDVAPAAPASHVPEQVVSEAPASEPAPTIANDAAEAVGSVVKKVTKRKLTENQVIVKSYKKKKKKTAA